MPESAHTYEQTNKELTVLVPLPSADLRAKEIEWRCTTAELRVRARGADLLCGKFFKPVKPDDSTWEIEDAPGGGRRLHTAPLYTLSREMSPTCACAAPL